MLTISRTTMNILPTINSSVSDARPLNLVQISIVNIVDAELNTEVREDIRAAIMTANMRPLNPIIQTNCTLATVLFQHTDLWARGPAQAE
jgi:hypothetical protein